MEFYVARDEGAQRRDLEPLAADVHERSCYQAASEAQAFTFLVDRGVQEDEPAVSATVLEKSDDAVVEAQLIAGSLRHVDDYSILRRCGDLLRRPRSEVRREPVGIVVLVHQPSKPFVLCVPSQNGLFEDPPQRQSAARSPSWRSLPSASVIRMPPLTRSGPPLDARISRCCGGMTLVPLSRLVRSAPDGQWSTASSISSAEASSASTQGRRSRSKTFGSRREQFPEWEQMRGSHSTTISSVAYCLTSGFCVWAIGGVPATVPGPARDAELA